MGRTAAVVLYVLAMVAVVVAVDVLLFKHQFLERLAVNVGFVLAFGGFYFRFLHHARVPAETSERAARPASVEGVQRVVHCARLPGHATELLRLPGPGRAADIAASR